MQTSSGDFLSYTLHPEDVAMDSETSGDVTFTVTETCTYTIHDAATNETVNFTNPEAWLNHAVSYFGGVSRTTDGAFLSGKAAPTMLDIKIEPLEDFFEVHIAAESLAVGGGAPLMWGFPSELQAEEFEYFLISMRKYSPDVFLTGETNNCGSGPVCAKLGTDVGYYDPKVNLLGLRTANGEEFYDDSLEWFNDCAKSLGCLKVAGGGDYLYLGSPGRSVEGTRFVFRDDGVDGEPIEYECFNVQDAQKLLSFADAVAHDPFHPLEVGGTF
jgi:hypothetical protein